MIISKVIARILKSVMGLVISETQIGFIEHRCITDGLITTKAIVSWLKKEEETWSSF